ncbi:MAG: hypothetical protein AAGJ83_14255 [Planctomycetota bacterium]
MIHLRDSARFWWGVPASMHKSSHDEFPLERAANYRELAIYQIISREAREELARFLEKHFGLA